MTDLGFCPGKGSDLTARWDMALDRRVYFLYYLPFPPSGDAISPLCPVSPFPEGLVTRIQRALDRLMRRVRRVEAGQVYLLFYSLYEHAHG